MIELTTDPYTGEREDRPPWAAPIPSRFDSCRHQPGLLAPVAADTPRGEERCRRKPLEARTSSPRALQRGLG